MKDLAETRVCCWRHFLFVAGVAVAMEGDPCRDGDLPEEVLLPIPADEMERATIDGKPIKDMPTDVVRVCRGDNWTPKMLDYVAAKINAAAKEGVTT